MNDEEWDCMKEEKFQFIEEVIKKSPGKLQRFASRFMAWIGLAVVFGLGVVIVVFAMGDNLRAMLFGKDNAGLRDGEMVSISVSNQEIDMAGIDMVKIRERVNQSIVKLIEANEEVGSAKVLGTGVILSKDSDVYVLANYNKLRSTNDLVVEFYDGSTAEATVFNGDVTLDIAVVEILSEDIKDKTLESIRYATVRNPDWLNKNYSCIYEGNAMREDILSYEGKIAGFSNIEDIHDIDSRLVYTDIQMNNINDGFLFDYNAELMGIVVRKLDKDNNSISAVTVYDMYHFIEQMINRENIGYLGIYGEYVDHENEKYMGEEIPEGLYVLDVDTDSAAHTYGIMKGDVIITIDETEINSMEDVEEIVLNKNPEDKIRVTLERKMGNTYEQIEITVEIGKRKKG